MSGPEGLTYRQVGVDAEAKAQGMARLLPWLEQTFALAEPHASSLLPIGYYAAVLRVRPDLGIAITTDNVGTKVLVAQMLGRYEGLGVDCVAINVNDLLCVGATPIALVDYLALAQVDPEVLEQLGRGLARGAKEAGTAIVGGETAQVPELLRGVREGSALDLSATAIGLVYPERLIVGAEIAPGDALVGLASSGIHCNGLTLARRVLLERAGYSVESYIPELGRTVGEALLEPTRIYVPVVRALMEAGLHLRALLHITADGLFNLLRVARRDIGYRITALPEPPPLFRLIRELGPVDDAEMYRVFNMGVGFCVVVPPEEARAVIATAAAHGIEAWQLGEVVHDPQRRVWLEPKGLVGQSGSFVAA